VNAGDGPVLEFWFDPGCPFTWATSVWAREAAAARGARISWHVMSLAVLNEGKPVPPQVQQALAASWRPVRVLAAAAQHDPEAVGPLYEALGQRVHRERRAVDDALLTEALHAAGLPVSLLAAADDTAHDAAVRASHLRGQELAGMESGSPITAYDGGPAFFGPVVSPVPSGDAGLDLWDALALLSRVPQLSELKRARRPLEDPVS
jgi:2-hydroxychromene-2-carboxylate isomerase